VTEARTFLRLDLGSPLEAAMFNVRRERNIHNRERLYRKRRAGSWPQYILAGSPQTSWKILLGRDRANRDDSHVRFWPEADPIG
jgi:hypothetical protein